MKALDALRQLGPESFRELVGLYLGDAPGLLADIRGAVERRAAPALLDAAHTLKSTSRLVGAFSVAAVAADLERLAKSQSLPELAAQVARADALFAEVSAILTKSIQES